MYTTTYYQTTMDSTAAAEISAAVLIPYIIFCLAISIVTIVATWKLFEKAGEKGWKSIIPFNNMYIQFKIIGWNPWMFLLLFVPFVNFVIALIIPFKLATAFKKSTLFGVGLLFIQIVFICILAFGDAKYDKSIKYKN